MRVQHWLATLAFLVSAATQAQNISIATGGTAQQRWHRALLRKLMEAEGFTVNPEEWWHFDYKDWKSYAIGNVPFENVK